MVRPELSRRPNNVDCKISPDPKPNLTIISGLKKNKNVKWKENDKIVKDKNKKLKMKSVGGEN